MNGSTSADARFLELVRRRLQRDRVTLARTLSVLSPADLAWRPDPAANSAANLVLHIVGNMNQRFAAALGGRPDTRDRDGEFEDRHEYTAEELMARVERAVSDADAIVAALDPSRLEEAQDVRGQPSSLREVLLDALCHYDQHIGQIIYIAKARRGLEFPELTVPRRKRA